MWHIKDIVIYMLVYIPKHTSLQALNTSITNFPRDHLHPASQVGSYIESLNGYVVQQTEEGAAAVVPAAAQEVQLRQQLQRRRGCSWPQQQQGQQQARQRRGRGTIRLWCSWRSWEERCS